MTNEDYGKLVVLATRLAIEDNSATTKEEHEHWLCKTVGVMYAVCALQDKDYTNNKVVVEVKDKMLADIRRAVTKIKAEEKGTK